jgi:glutamine amidotransferase
VLKGDVVPFAENLGVKVPQMGWNTLKITRPGCPILRGLPDEAAFYFVHGYYAVPSDPGTTIATSDYPNPFCAAVWQENVFATQFHPEKSQAMGQVLLRNFAEL